MKSFTCLLVALSLALVYASKEPDTTIVITEQRTVTVCPVTQLNICENDSDFDPTKALTTGDPTAVPSVSADSTREWSEWWSGSSGNEESSFSSTGVYGSTTGFQNTSLTTTTTSTTGFSNATTTTSQSSNTSSKTCATGTPEALVDSNCNTPDNRKDWCKGKSIESNTHDQWFTGETKRFTLTITNTTLNFDGQDRPSFAINGQSPGPAIEANWGDMVEVVVTNLLQDNATAIHWHGIRQLGTNDQDGVPGVSECGIAPGQSKVYTWHASTYGTGWYHSHLLAQYGGGIRGPIIIHGPTTANYDIDMGSVMIDDIFEGTIFQMAWRASHTGAVNTTNYLLNGKNVAPDMSRGEHQKWTLKPGKKHLFRIINSSGQNAYAVRFDSHTMKVVAADFTPIVPYNAEWLYITNGQRYDVVIEANQPVSSYFLRAVTQTGCPSICYNNGLGLANGILQYQGDCGTFPVPDLANATTSMFSGCKDEPFLSLNPWYQASGATESDLRSQLKTISGVNAALSPVGNGRVFRWFLNSNAMNLTYTQPTLKTLATVPQSHNGTALSNAIVLNTSSDSDWVYFVIQNSFFVSHPMHLHGHDFSIFGQGPGVFDSSLISSLNFNNPIRRDTAFLYGSRTTPNGYTVIGWQTDNPGAWLMHCHLIFHAEGGMALQYIERPDSIKSFWDDNQGDIQGQCKEMTEYEAQGLHRSKLDYESGLKRKWEGEGGKEKRHYHGHGHGHSHGHRHQHGVVRH